MAASFVLELDTTGPVIKAFGPSYATTAYPETIIIESSEQLADYQDIYFIDSAGTRHDVIFSHDSTRMTGIVYFTLFSYGIATMYSRLMDDVNNLSNTAIYHVNILKSAELDITVSGTNRQVNSLEMQRIVLTTDETRKINIDENTRNIALAENIRAIEVSEE